MASRLSYQIESILTKQGKAINGRDSDDSDMKYPSIQAWELECGLLTRNLSPFGDGCEADDRGLVAAKIQLSTSSQSRRQWYKTGYDYWEDESNCPATVDGVLGGYACLSQRDLRGSKDFLTHLRSDIRPELMFVKEDNEGVPTCAVECGAGIGRCTKGLLLPLGITQCDLVESSPRLLNTAPDYLGDNYSSKCRFFCTGLQDFEPKSNTYNIIWIQWVIGYLTDSDLIDFLKRCGLGLCKGGVIVIKDNTCEDEAFIVDRDDASVTRSLPYILALVGIAGLRVVYQQYQEDFPENIFPVPMIALEPKEWTHQ